MSPLFKLFIIGLLLFGSAVAFFLYVGHQGEKAFLEDAAAGFDRTEVIDGKATITDAPEYDKK